MQNPTTSRPVVELLTIARKMGLIDEWRTAGQDILFQRGASNFLAPPFFTAMFLLRLMERRGRRHLEKTRAADVIGRAEWYEQFDPRSQSGA